MAGALARAADYHNVPWVARKELATRVFLVTSHGGAASFAAPSSSAAMRAASSPIAAVTRPLPRREGLLDLLGRRCAPTCGAVLPLCPKLVTWRERAVGSKSKKQVRGLSGLPRPLREASSAIGRLGGGPCCVRCVVGTAQSTTTRHRARKAQRLACGGHCSAKGQSIHQLGLGRVKLGL